MDERVVVSELIAAPGAERRKMRLRRWSPKKRRRKQMERKRRVSLMKVSGFAVTS